MFWPRKAAVLAVKVRAQPSTCLNHELAFSCRLALSNPGKLHDETPQRTSPRTSRPVTRPISSTWVCLRCYHPNRTDPHHRTVIRHLDFQFYHPQLSTSIFTVAAATPQKTMERPTYDLFRQVPKLKGDCNLQGWKSVVGNVAFTYNLERHINKSVPPPTSDGGQILRSLRQMGQRAKIARHYAQIQHHRLS